MEFVLHYRGELSPKANAAAKHHIRQHFHLQMQKMQEDEDSQLKYLFSWPGREDHMRQMGPFQFDALVGRWATLLAELEITLLRPEAPGGIVHYGGDIDNRLKTLFDAMAVPSQKQALPPDAKPGEGERPFFCVLEDDRQITKLTIHTERLWESVKSPHEVELIVLVRPVDFYG